MPEFVGHPIGDDFHLPTRRQQVAQATGAHHFPAIDDDHVVGDLFHFGQNVGAEEDGLPFGLQLGEQLQNFAAAGGVEPGCRLVEHDQFGIAEQGLRDADTLHHAARILADFEILVAFSLTLLSKSGIRVPVLSGCGPRVGDGSGVIWAL